jgi:hypothetical protein
LTRWYTSQTPFGNLKRLVFRFDRSSAPPPFVAGANRPRQPAALHPHYQVSSLLHGSPSCASRRYLPSQFQRPGSPWTVGRVAPEADLSPEATGSRFAPEPEPSSPPPCRAPPGQSRSPPGCFRGNDSPRFRCHRYATTSRFTHVRLLGSYLTPSCALSKCSPPRLDRRSLWWLKSPLRRLRGQPPSLAQPASVGPTFYIDPSFSLRGARSSA